MAEGAGAGLMQQSSQDLASWKYFSYIIYCARGGKSWPYRTYQSHHAEEDILLEMKRRAPQITRRQDLRYCQEFVPL